MVMSLLKLQSSTARYKFNKKELSPVCYLKVSPDFQPNMQAAMWLEDTEEALQNSK